MQEVGVVIRRYRRKKLLVCVGGGHGRSFLLIACWWFWVAIVVCSCSFVITVMYQRWLDNVAHPDGPLMCHIIARVGACGAAGVVGVVYWMGGVRRSLDCGHHVVMVMELVKEKKRCHMLWQQNQNSHVRSQYMWSHGSTEFEFFFTQHPWLTLTKTPTLDKGWGFCEGQKILTSTLTLLTLTLIP